MKLHKEPSVGEKYNFPSALIVLCRALGSVNPIKGAALGDLSGSYQPWALAPLISHPPPPGARLGIKTRRAVLFSLLFSLRALGARRPTDVPRFCAPERGHVLISAWN